MKLWILPGVFPALLPIAAFAAPKPSSLPELLELQQRVRAGRQVFVSNCAGCHGTDADGKGPAAPMLDPRPRNLVSGSFKFRSTPSGSLPTAEDLLRTIDQGVLGTSMPSFRLMPANEKLALVSYIQSLRADWAELQGRSIALPDPPEEIFRKKATLLASAMRGRQLFMDACQTCHGDRGLGDGPGAEGLIDGEERIIRPADFTRPFLKSGARVKDIYKVVSTGLDGTPMPSFAETYTEAQRWDLVAFVLVRRGQGAGLYPADLDLQLGGTAPVAAAPTTPSAAPAAAPAKGEPSKPSQTGADEWK